ncbi:MAG: hypothetical protein RLZ12_344 [Bacillota bacterium]|jgi:DNA-directed RNA polymerase subunit alpha
MIEKPKVEVKELSEDNRYGCFVIEPLERGYGVTLGNSLRRILLSSLPGAAITRVQFEGALHEFSTLPGVVEDTTEIILNLKQVALKIYGQEEQSLEIDSIGPGVVTAGDIKCSSEVEIINKDLVLATLSEGAHLRGRLTANCGRGYVPAEQNKQEKPVLGVIPIDSVYTPVERVNYNVENTRVGRVTNYDKLMLEVWSRGTLSPVEAVGLGSRILTDYLGLFMGLHEGEENIATVKTKHEELENTRALDMPIEDLGLSVRSYNCLKRAGINNIHDLVQRSEQDMMRVRNLGSKSLEEVCNKLSLQGLTLRED